MGAPAAALEEEAGVAFSTFSLSAPFFEEAAEDGVGLDEEIGGVGLGATGGVNLGIFSGDDGADVGALAIGSAVAGAAALTLGEPMPKPLSSATSAASALAFSADIAALATLARSDLLLSAGVPFFSFGVVLVLFALALLSLPLGVGAVGGFFAAFPFDEGVASSFSPPFLLLLFGVFLLVDDGVDDAAPVGASASAAEGASAFGVSSSRLDAHAAPPPPPPLAAT